MTYPTFKTKIPPGTYVLGDPCYSLAESASDQFWDGGRVDWKFYDTTIEHEGHGHRAMAFCTAYGDGCFFDQNGHPYGVDAGVIGLVAVELTDPAKLARTFQWVQTVTFKRAVTCTRSPTGVLKFGPYKIKTGE